ncbi:clathrin coat assembly protein AP180-like [Schistocerca cancellata]|uniref:clathrin coat assembly protein AP180-like n=1 Tax=Schistocerca cancellata TaxID=274614 RepID=UPI002118C518|nr:clathrin coat assembly protein AP180-like [Schistocerca cancellata]
MGRQSLEPALAEAASCPLPTTDLDLDMDTETGHAPTASASRYADPASAGEASGAAGTSRPPPTANRRTKSGAKRTRWRVLTTSDGLPSLTVARISDVGGPQTSSPTSTETSEAAAGRPVADTSNGAPSDRKNSGATGATEADKHLQFLTGLIPGAQKPGNHEENPALEPTCRKRRAEVSHDIPAKRPAAGTSDSAPRVRTQQKATRKGTRIPPDTDEGGFRKPTRKHTARAVVLAAAADGAITANRYRGCQAFKRAATVGRPAPSRPVQVGKSFAAAAATSAAPTSRPAQRQLAHPSDVQGRGRRREQPAPAGVAPAAETTAARAENRRGKDGGRPNNAPAVTTPAERALPPPTQTTETPAAPSEAAELREMLREFEQLILHLPHLP